VDRQIHLIARGAEVKQDKLILENCALLDYYAVGIRCVITSSVFLFWTTYYENREKRYVIHF
jgi:hypothetical protein